MPDLAGRLRCYIDAWDRIGASPIVKSWISHGVPVIFEDKPPLPFEIKNRPFTSKEITFLHKEIADLLAVGAITKASGRPHCISPIKCVPKKGGKLRLVTNLYHFNQFVRSPPFQYENIQTVSHVLNADDCMISFDLKNGFFHCPITVSDRKYFGFKFNGTFYTWCVCPFGWSTSPYYFNKLVKPVSVFLRDNGIK